MNEGGWRRPLILAGCVLICMVSAAPVIATTTSLFIVPISREFGWGRTEFPLAIMAAAWIGGLVAPVAGGMLDRYGTKPIMLIGTVAFALSNVLLAFSDGVKLHVYPAYMLLGASSSFCGNFGVNKIISAWFSESRGKALGLSVGLGVGLGSALTPLLTEYFIQHGGWRFAYVALGTAVFVLAFPSILFLTPNTRSPKSSEPITDASAGLSVSQSLATREFWLIIALTLFNGFAAGAISGHWAPIQVERGVSIEVATLLLSSFGLVKVLAQVGGGALLDRIQTPKLAALILFPAFLAATAYAFASGPRLVVPAALLFGLGEGAELGLLPYLVSRYFGVRRIAEIFGYVAAASIISAGLGNVAMGSIFDATHSYRFGLFIGAGCLLLAVLCAIGLGPYRFEVASHRMKKAGDAENLAPVTVL